MNVSQEEVKQCAYRFWEEAGCPLDKDAYYWDMAESILSYPVICAAEELRSAMENDEKGGPKKYYTDKKRLIDLCAAVDFWIAADTMPAIEELGLGKLASEIKKDFVLSLYLAYRGEYKLSYISMRSYFESFCLLLYYLNQGFERTLYLKGCGYKHMLHRMVQKKQPDDTHAFRRHYQILLEDGSGGKNYADKFFEDIESLYGVMSKAVHGDYVPKDDETPEKSFEGLICRVLRSCNTLALHDAVFAATEDELSAQIGHIIEPVTFTIKKAVGKK